MASTPAVGADELAPRAVRAGVRGTYGAFIGSGFAFASWAARIPQVRDHLRLTPAGLGLLLLCVAAGSIVALPLSGVILHRYGARRTVTVMSLLFAVGLATVALGYLGGVVPVVIGLLLMGFANGAWDVGMNLHGALVERHLGRSIMPRFHAGWSLGTVVGALLGAAAVAAHVPVTAHLLVVTIVVGFLVPWGARSFVPDPPRQGDDHPDRRSVFAAWREPRTVLLGVFVLAFAFAEGTGNDWIGVATIDGHKTTAAIGTLALASFLAAMTIGRWFGPRVLDRFGRVAVIRVLAITAIGGSLLFVFAPATPLAFVGTVLWGLGSSLGFPVGMSAGADEPQHAAGRVSVIASIGYCAFLAGPPVIGFLGDHLTVLHALTAVAVLLALAAAISSVLAPPNDTA